MAYDVMDTSNTRRYHFISRKYCSATFWKEERGTFHGDGLFHREVLICERRVASTIDGSSTINLINIEVVEKLQLPTCACEVSYFLDS
jgi:hypothetical protein